MRPYPDDTLTSDIQRVKLTIAISSFAMVLLLINELLHTPFDAIETAISISIVCLLLLNFWVNEDTVQLASGIILWGTSTLVFYLSWSQQGIYDTALYAYPCIILLAYVMGSRLLFIPLFAAIMVQVVLLLFAHDANLFPLYQASESSHLIRAIDLFIILSLFATISFIFIRGFKLSFKHQKQLANYYQQELDIANKLLEFDNLTNLPNDKVCAKQLAEFLTTIDTTDTRIAVVILDITNMRQINNSLGHSVGNTLLLTIAERLQSMLDAHEFLYRHQGHEFALIKQSEYPREIDIFKERILQAMTTEFDVEDYRIAVNCAIGIAVAPFDGNAHELLFKHAHLALQHGKRSAVNDACYYEPYMKDLEEQRYFYVNELKQAISQDQLAVYYQPKIHLPTQRVVGAEALIRWIHPEKGFIPPDKFIPIAEESGQITEITKWVIENACLDCAHWHLQGYKHMSIAVNLSALDFRRGNLPHLVMKAVNASRLPANALELEITESIIFDDLARIQTQIRHLKHKGVSFAIDDFGTGYSNLGYLNKFNVSTLKIDRSFVHGLLSNEHDQHIVNAIINLSKSLGIDNVAEGIEDQQTAKWLLKRGCQIGQGYHWSKPLPAHEFLEYLAKTHKDV
ncbi:putative bifunctional diguanylate cyclase/phosphodiesterase [Thalassotalea fusca]